MTHVFKILKNRTTEISVLQASIVKEGERGVDQGEFQTPKSTDISVNDRIEMIFDIVPVEGLSAIYCFQGGVKDESTNVNHGTATDITYQNETDYFGKEAVFNGTSSFVSVSDADTLDLSGVFDIFVWAKWSSTTEQFILSKRSSGTNGFALSVNASTAGDVKFYIGSDTITSSSSGFNDGDKHLIRIKRDSDNLVTMYVDNTSVGTVTSTYDPTDTNDLLMGKDYGGSFFAGKLLRLRLYKGENKLDNNATKIYSQINPRSVIKFGGFVTKIDIELSFKKVTCQSYGKALAETDVRSEAYDNKTVEYIVEDLITANTNFTYNDGDIATGLSVDNFIADGKMIDIISDFAAFTNRTFYITPNEEFFFVPLSFNSTSVNFVHGTNGANISKSAFDDSKLINSITLIGEIISFSTQEAFNGNNSDTVFTLQNAANGVLVKISGVEKSPEGVDYELDTLKKQITFNTPPPTGTANITVDYTYEKPMVIKGEKPSSITQYGIHSKKFNLSWVNNRTDGVRFVQSYLNRYSTVRENVNSKFGEALLYLNENDVIGAKNTFIGIDNSFAIKAIRWTYPEFNTELTLGEYRFDYFESDREIVRKLHDYESSLTQSKEIQDYESPEEVLNLGDVIITYVIDEYAETLNMTDTKNVYDKTVAVYGSGTYGSRTSGEIYGS